MKRRDDPEDRLYESFFQDSQLPYCDEAGARAFLDDVAAASPPDQQALITGKVIPALEGDAPQEARLRILRQVADAARDAGLETPFRKHDARVLETVLKPFLDAINDDGRDGRRVLFVCTTPFFVILREAIHLRRRGHRVCLLSLSPLPRSLRPLFERHFDLVADARNSFRFLRAMLTRLTPEVVHVQCWMWMYVLGRAAIEACPDSAVVCEFYDSTTLFAERDDLATRWRPALVDLDRRLEGFILRHADAVVSRYAPDIAEAWAAMHDARPRYLEFQPYPCPEFIHYADDRPSNHDGVIRLLHAGSFVPPDAEHPPTLFPETSMPRVFRSLLEQGFAIDVLCPPQFDEAELGPQFDAYRQLARDFPRFRFMNGAPPDRFAEVAAGYDYGILLFDYSPEVTRLGELWRRGTMPAKFFAYLEAGLPGIVVGEYENMARFLEDNGLGLGVPSADLPRLGEILARQDHAAMVANIRRYNETQGMPEQIHRLITLYDAVCGPSGEAG